jgi:GNAT superfamily N-acetyltransferase
VTMATSIRSVSASALVRLLPTLANLLQETVNKGSSLGFLPPLTRNAAWDYWRSLRPELQAGSRRLLAAYVDDRLVGSGQLSFPWLPASRHRAELQKLFIAPAVRGQGVGRALMAALHDAAREHRRSLVVLNTRRGEPAEAFYKGLGYSEVGVIPGWTIGPAGEQYDHVTLYQRLPALEGALVPGGNGTESDAGS